MLYNYTWTHSKLYSWTLKWFGFLRVGNTLLYTRNHPRIWLQTYFTPGYREGNIGLIFSDIAKNVSPCHGPLSNLNQFQEVIQFLPHMILYHCFNINCFWLHYFLFWVVFHLQEYWGRIQFIWRRRLWKHLIFCNTSII